MHPIHDFPNAPTYKLLIVDDHTLVSDLLSEMLSHVGGFHVECAESLCAAETKVADDGPFDLVLLDYKLPDGNGLRSLAAMIKLNKGNVALFSGQAGPVIAIEALNMGAVGFVSKSSSPESLVHALRLMASGETYISAWFLDRSVTNGGMLKSREERVLALLAEGCANKEIALLTDLTETTVKNDVKALCKKLNVRNRTELVVAAQRLQLV